MSIPLWLQCNHLLMASSSRIMHHVTKIKSYQTGFLNMAMNSLFTQMASTVTRSQSSRAPLGCRGTVLNQIKSSNQITFIVTSPQHKCLGEWNSYERAPDSAEIQQTIYLWTDSAKKQQQQFTYGQTVQKSNSNLHMDSTYLQTVQKTMCKIHIHILSTHSVL